MTFCWVSEKRLPDAVASMEADGARESDLNMSREGKRKSPTNVISHFRNTLHGVPIIRDQREFLELLDFLRFMHCTLASWK